METVVEMWKFARKPCALAVAATLSAGSAHAQQAPQSGADGGATTQLPDIVVTANKRQEESSKVPISIATFNKEQLEASGVKTLADLAALTPGVEFDNSASFGPGTLTNIAIRGINSTVGTSTTGIYIDDTPVQARITALSYFGNPLPIPFDVDRVEVERGPQGTLFGAGAEGGALHFIAAEPSLKEASGQLRGEVATTRNGSGSYEAGASYSAPITAGTLGYHAAAWYREDGGYIDRVDPFSGAVIDKAANKDRSYAVRGSGTAAFGDTRITISEYDQNIHHDDSSAFYEYLSNPGGSSYQNGRLLPQPSTDQFSLTSAKGEVDFGAATLTAVTSYLERSGRLQNDMTSFLGATFAPLGVSYGNPLGGAYPVSYADAAANQLTTALHQFTQEVRLSSNDGAAPLRWTAGVFFQRSHQSDGEVTYSAFYNENLFNLPPGAPNYVSLLDAIDSQLALFGQADYRVVDKLTATVGLRVSRIASQFSNFQEGGPAAGLPPTNNATEIAHPVTPKFGLAYQLDDANMAYATVAKGFRAGGGNFTIPTNCPISRPAPYQPDSLWSYELGSKNKLAGGRVRLDASAFHVDWKDIQQTVNFASCGFGYITNTGSAASNGADLGINAAATENLTLGLSLAFTHAYLKHSVVVPDAASSYLLVQQGDAVGGPPAVNSPWDITTSFEYAFTVFEGRDSYLRVEDIYHSRNTAHFSSQIANTPQYDPQITGNPSTNLVNVRLGTDRRNNSFALYVNNALNSHPLLGRIHDVPASTLFTDLTFRPRTVGLTYTYHL